MCVSWWLLYLLDRRVRSSCAGRCSGRYVGRTVSRCHTRRSLSSPARNDWLCSLKTQNTSVSELQKINELLKEQFDILGNKRICILAERTFNLLLINTTLMFNSARKQFSKMSNYSFKMVAGHQVKG